MSKLLEMQGICKSFYGVEVLHAVDFSLEKGEIRALCGENGAGKSTLMKVLSGIYEQNDGEVHFKNVHIKRTAEPLEVQAYGISMIHQELNLFDDLTVAQNIYLCREPKGKNGLIDFSEMNMEASRLLKRLGESIDPKTPVRELKIAQKQMVEIAKAISFNVELLIMDEPTAVLTGKETEIMFNLMRSLSEDGISIIYISHRLKEITEVCHSVTVLRDGSYIDTKKVADVTEKDIATLMVGREVQHSSIGDFSGDEDDVILEVLGVTDNMLDDVSFSVRRGEIVCFSGLVGAGRTELMEVIFGIRRPESGQVLIDGKPVTVKSAIDAIKIDIGLVTEDRKDTGLVLCRDITENSNYVFWRKNKGIFKGVKKTRSNTGGMIERLNIKCAGSDQDVANLSGGNQQKVALAKWLLSDAKVLILDEPTRGVDVGARQEIYQIIRELAESGIGIVIVSSDMQEVMSVSQRVVVMHEGRKTGELKCSEMEEEKIMYMATNV
ncbi:MAG TPA: D-xylose ABC transporter ATP-binding protein [Spirochaeta sp.]|nr:D-xylose ABC transporter ATP-binding protein [Spirochaeta sp.]